MYINCLLQSFAGTLVNQKTWFCLDEFVNDDGEINICRQNQSHNKLTIWWNLPFAKCFTAYTPSLPKILPNNETHFARCQRPCVVHVPHVVFKLSFISPVFRCYVFIRLFSLVSYHVFSSAVIILQLSFEGTATLYESHIFQVYIIIWALVKMCIHPRLVFKTIQISIVNYSGEFVAVISYVLMLWW